MKYNNSEKDPFRDHTLEYEAWFTKYPQVYAAELRAVQALLPDHCDRILEIGVGSGKFARDLGVTVGVDPCPEMLVLAKGRGVVAVLGTAESLPLTARQFDCVVMITVLCFLRDPAVALAQARQVLRQGGHLVMAFVDRHSPLGESYCLHQEESLFYRKAHFYGADEVGDLMAMAGFRSLRFCQTIVSPLSEVDANEPVLPGSGQGGFAVVRGEI